MCSIGSATRSLLMALLRCTTEKPRFAQSFYVNTHTAWATAQVGWIHRQIGLLFMSSNSFVISEKEISCPSSECMLRFVYSKLGNLYKYVSMFRKSARIQGGFIWDWVDQGILTPTDKRIIDRSGPEFKSMERFAIKYFK